MERKLDRNQTPVF